jgi:hypothetical protein
VAASWRAFRRSILTPTTNETEFSTRGFDQKSSEARIPLESVVELTLPQYLAPYNFAPYNFGFARGQRAAYRAALVRANTRRRA